MNSLFDKKSAVPVGVSRVVVYVPISQTKGSFMNCLVSVIVPVCNVETYLEQALNTLKSQTLCDIEVICVDDGSTDSSRSIIEGYCERDARFRLMAQNNRGAALARNRGLGEASGKYVIFLDSDDFFEPTLLQRMYERIEEYGADICLCGAYNFNCLRGVEEKSNAVLKTGYLQGVDVFSSANMPATLFSTTSPAPWSKLYRRDFLIAHNHYFQDLGNSNDVFFNVSTFASAAKIVYVPECLIHYRLARPGSLQNSDRIKNPEDFCVALRASFRYLEDEGYLPALQEAFTDLAADIVTFNLSSALCVSQWFEVYKCSQTFANDINSHFALMENGRFASSWLLLCKKIENVPPSEYLWREWAVERDRARENDRNLIIEREKVAKEKERTQEICSSNSYRIGRAVTMPLRKMKKFIKR